MSDDTQRERLARWLMQETDFDHPKCFKKADELRALLQADAEPEPRKRTFKQGRYDPSSGAPLPDIAPPSRERDE